MGRLTTRAYF